MQRRWTRIQEPGKNVQLLQHNVHLINSLFIFIIIIIFNIRRLIKKKRQLKLNTHNSLIEMRGEDGNNAIESRSGYLDCILDGCFDCFNELRI